MSVKPAFPGSGIMLAAADGQQGGSPMGGSDALDLDRQVHRV